MAISLPVPSNQERAEACLSLSPKEFRNVDYENNMEKKEREREMKTNTSHFLPFLMQLSSARHFRTLPL